MPTIGYLNYKVTADNNQLKQAMVATKAELREGARVMRDTADDSTILSAKLDRLEHLYKQGAISLETYGRAQVILKTSTDSAKEAQAKHAQAKAEAMAITDRHTTAEERHAKALKRLEELKPQLPIQAYNAEVARLSRTLPDAIAKEERLAAAKARFSQVMQEAKSVTDSVITAEERRYAKLSQLNNLVKRGAIDQETYNRAIAKESSLIGSHGGKSNYTGGSGMGAPSVAGMAARVNPVAGLALGGIAAAGAGIAFSVDQASEIQQTNVAFEVLTGSLSKTKTLMKEMRALDANSALSFGSISAAGKTLLGFGVETEKTMPALRSLGDISLGNDERFKSLALAFGQVRAAGRLTGQEVLQMVNNGFNPLQEISRLTGKSLEQLREEMGEGKLSFELFEKAILSATAAGGRFNGLNEAMSKTASGSWGKVKSELSVLGSELGQDFLQPITQINQTVSGVLSRLNANLKESRKYFEEQTTAAETSGKKVAETWEETYKRVVTAQNSAKEAADRKEQAFLAKGATGREALESRIAELEAEKRKLTKSELEIQREDLGGNLGIGHRTQSDNEQIKHGLKLIDQVEKLKKAKEEEKKLVEQRERAEQEAARKKEQELEKLREKAKAIRDDANPLNGIQEKLNEIEQMRSRGMIYDTEANTAREKVLNDAAKEKNTMATPQTITRGSAEEYKLRVAQQAGKDQLLFNQAKKQETLAKLQLDELKKANAKPAVNLVAAR